MDFINTLLGRSDQVFSLCHCERDAHNAAPGVNLAVSIGFLFVVSLLAVFLLHKGYKLRH